MSAYVMYGKTRLSGKKFSEKRAQTGLIRRRPSRLECAGCSLCSELEAEGERLPCKMGGKECTRKGVACPHLIDNRAPRRINMEGLSPRTAIDSGTIALYHPHSVGGIVLDGRIQGLKLSLIAKDEIGILSDQCTEDVSVAPRGLRGSCIERHHRMHTAGSPEKRFEIARTVCKQSFRVNYRDMIKIEAINIHVADAPGHSGRCEDEALGERVCARRYKAHRTKNPSALASRGHLEKCLHTCSMKAGAYHIAAGVFADNSDKRSLCSEQGCHTHRVERSSARRVGKAALSSRRLLFQE